MNSTSLAYLLVAFCYMLPEADAYRLKLNLSTPSPLYRTNLVAMSIAGGNERLRGFVATTNYIFSFAEDGFLEHVGKKMDAPIREYQRKLATQYSEVGPREAYQIATQWLGLLDMDLQLLERSFKHRVTYPKTDKAVTVITPSGETRRSKVVPWFCVSWGKQGDPGLEDRTYAIQVHLLGPTRELQRLELNSVFSKRPEFKVPGESVLMKLPNEPFSLIWTNRELSVSNVFPLLRTSTAYQSVMLKRMLSEANWTLDRLGLNAEKLSMEDLIDSFVAPPEYGARGCIEGKNSLFEFDQHGRLKFMLCRPGHPRAAYSIRKPMTTKDHEALARLPSVVNSNMVAELAIKWLGSVEVDTNELSRITRPIVTRYMCSDTTGKQRFSHIWWVSWWDPRGQGSPILSVQVDGATGNPERLEFSNTSYSLRPTISVEDADKLMRVPDAVPQRDPLRAHLNVMASNK